MVEQMDMYDILVLYHQTTEQLLSSGRKTAQSTLESKTFFKRYDLSNLKI